MTPRFRVLVLILLPSLAQAASTVNRLSTPNIGVDFLGLARRGTHYSSDRTQSIKNGLSLQEAELSLSSDVDPYLRASALFSVSQEAGSSSFSIDPEEIFVETLSIPHLTLKAGKYKLAFGKHNTLHTHAFPFIDAPLTSVSILGTEGLNEAALGASALIPTPWFLELTVQGFDPSNDTLFNSKAGSLGGLVRLKNLWDLNDDSTLEWGMSGVKAKNSLDKKAHAIGSDLTFKWRPSEKGIYHALIANAEYLYGSMTGTLDATTGLSTERLSGLVSYLQYQFAERWWLSYRYEFSGLNRSEGFNRQIKHSFLIGFYPSEFSGFRLQYDWLRNSARLKSDHALSIQYNISFGAHPAHSY